MHLTSLSSSKFLFYSICHDAFGIFFTNLSIVTCSFSGVSTKIDTQQQSIGWFFLHDNGKWEMAAIDCSLWVFPFWRLLNFKPLGFWEPLIAAFFYDERLFPGRTTEVGEVFQLQSTREVSSDQPRSTSDAISNISYISAQRIKSLHFNF